MNERPDDSLLSRRHYKKKTVSLRKRDNTLKNSLPGRFISSPLLLLSMKVQRAVPYPIELASLARPFSISLSKFPATE